MIRALLLSAAFLVPAVAYAQDASKPAPKPEMVILPREVVVGLLEQVQAIGKIDPGLERPGVIQAVMATVACLQDNPVGGRLTRQGQDQCPPVTDALADQAKALADANAATDKANKDAADQKAANEKALTDAKAAAVKAIEDTKAADQKATVAQVAEAKRAAEAPLKARIAALAAQIKAAAP